MNTKSTNVFASLGIIVLLAIVIYDSRWHFDAGLIQLKRQHQSAQGNWNIFYGQHYVYQDSSFRYQADFAEIEKLIEPGKLLLSDIATSYFAAAELPVFIRNVRIHQGRNKSTAWRNFLGERTACYLNQIDSMDAFREFILSENSNAKRLNRPEFKYVIVNKDTLNLNLRYDCLWHGRHGMIENMQAISTLVYQGEYLNLYKLNALLVEIP